MAFLRDQYGICLCQFTSSTLCTTHTILNLSSSLRLFHASARALCHTFMLMNSRRRSVLAGTGRGEARSLELASAEHYQIYPALVGALVDMLNELIRITANTAVRP